ncbi:hypothetical protein ABZ568_24860 [Streptomyces olindensis]|uniref:Uncharacterized protein n=1 Tax=Streptomyces olindensis TaxID=358823 RepID=A0ABV2Y0J7_9ACTN
MRILHRDEDDKQVMAEVVKNLTETRRNVVAPFTTDQVEGYK